MSDETILAVPFAEKDEAKSLGARWNPKLKVWYVPAGLPVDAFSNWLPEKPSSPSIQVFTPVFLIHSKEPCWKCGGLANVVALGSRGLNDKAENFTLNDHVIYSFVHSVPPEIEKIVQDKCPSWRMDYSRTTNSNYYMNHCSCGASQGDFFLHNEPGGAFMPMDREDCASISIRTLQGISPFMLGGGYGVTDENLIFRYAKVVL